MSRPYKALKTRFILTLPYIVVKMFFVSTYCVSLSFLAESGQGMQCPFCKTDDSRVTDTRVTDGGATIRRRRECIHCSKRFTTYEKSETIIKLMVVKKDGSRVPYERAKILSGLEKACYKRPVSEAQLELLVDRILSGELEKN